MQAEGLFLSRPFHTTPAPLPLCRYANPKNRLNRMTETRPVRFNPESIDTSQIQAILSTGSLESLPAAQREYYGLMEMVRGLKQRSKTGGGKAVTKAAIIRLLKSEQYGLTDYQARRVYDDSLNFFYQQEHVTVDAFRNLYAERCEQWADEAYAAGDVKEARALIRQAAELRGCFDRREAPEIPEELLNRKQTVIYTASREDIGLPEIDRKQLEAFIDSIPDLSEPVRQNLKEDARIKKMDLKKRMLYDIEELSEEDHAER